MRDLAMKGLAVAVLLVAGWVLLKVVIGAVTAIAWIVVVIGAVIAVFWALSKL
jgi:hypothetical protein